MIDYLLHYWYFTLALLALLVFTGFVWRKALRAAKRGRAARNELFEKMKYQNEARRWFRALQEEDLAAAENQRLFDGAALAVQEDLERSGHMDSAFQDLPQAQQWVYALYYLMEDAATSLSHFFKQNGKPLTPSAKEAVRAVLGEEAAAIFNPMYQAFDEEDEEASLITAQLHEGDDAFAAYLAQTDTAALTAQYIRENFNQFGRAI